MIDRLREPLRAATPGPWGSFTEFRPNGGPGMSGGVYQGTMSEMGPTVCRVPEPLSPDAAYIAACDPDTIAELLDAHDRMAGALTEMAWLADVKCDCPPDYTERGRHRPADACLPDELRLSDATVTELRRAAVPKENR